MHIGHVSTRVSPGMPPENYQTYRIVAPLRTHWAKATCEEIDCEAFLCGWCTTVDESTELGGQQAYFIRHDKTRTAVETHTPGGLTEFTFPPGQHCFAWRSHRKRVGRPDIYSVEGGDWRGNPLGTRYVHSRPEDWVDDFATHEQKLSDLRQRG